MVLAGLLGALNSAPAQLSMGEPTGVNSAFVHLFAPNTNWTAKVDVQALDGQRKEWVSLPMEMTMQGSSIRMDMNLEQLKSKELPGIAILGLKQAGMTRVTTLVRPDLKATYVVYPGARSYLNLPVEGADLEAMQKGYQTERGALGKAAVEGRVCEKNRMVVKSGGSVALEAVTWNAPELSGFPVVVETTERDKTIIMKFRDVKFAAPDKKIFELPAGYTEYRNAQAMILGIMKQMVSGDEEAN